MLHLVAVTLSEIEYIRLCRQWMKDVVEGRDDVHEANRILQTAED